MYSLFGYDTYKVYLLPLLLGPTHFVVQIPTDLRELAVPLYNVLDTGALHEVGVLPVGVHDLLQALGVAGHKDLVRVSYEGKKWNQPKNGH